MRFDLQGCKRAMGVIALLGLLGNWVVYISATLLDVSIHNANPINENDQLEPRWSLLLNPLRLYTDTDDWSVINYVLFWMGIAALISFVVLKFAFRQEGAVQADNGSSGREPFFKPRAEWAFSAAPAQAFADPMQGSSAPTADPRPAAPPEAPATPYQPARYEEARVKVEPAASPSSGSPSGQFGAAAWQSPASSSTYQTQTLNLSRIRIINPAKGKTKIVAGPRPWFVIAMSVWRLCFWPIYAIRLYGWRGWFMDVLVSGWLRFCHKVLGLSDKDQLLMVAIAELVIGFWIAFTFDRLLLLKCLKKGWVFAEPDSLETQQVKERWKIA